MISPNNSLSTNTVVSPAAFVTREDDGCHDPDRRRRRRQQQQSRDIAEVAPSVDAGVPVTFDYDGPKTTTAVDCAPWPTDTEGAAAGVTDRTPLLRDIDGGGRDDVGYAEDRTVNGCFVNV